MRISRTVAKPASCEWSCKRAPKAWDILGGPGGMPPPQNFWNIDPRNAICSNLSIKFQKIAWSNEGKRCGYFGIFQTTTMKIDTKIGNLWSAVRLIIVIPAIVHFFSIRKYYMHVLYYHSLYRLPNFWLITLICYPLVVFQREVWRVVHISRTRYNFIHIH
jgi:hypothetical protein